MTDTSEIIKHSCDYFDLTNDNHYQMVRDLADSMLAAGYSETELWDILPDKAPLHSGLAAMIAISRLKLLKHAGKPFNLAITINLIHEQNRLRPSTFDNPNGENALRNKIKQLKWISRGTQLKWKLVYVSGGCPWGSDEVLKKIIKEEGLSEDQVVLLDTREYEVAKDLPRNQKGSEIIFAANTIAKLPGYPDVGDFDGFLFTDADMTLDMAQIGYLVDEYLANGRQFTIGSRKHRQSILRKNPTRPGPGVSMYRHITRRLGQTFFEDLNLTDTQCPWKFVAKPLLLKLAPLLNCPDWSIDTDFIGAARQLGHEINIIPITAIDSEKESHGHAIAGGPATRLITIVQGLLQQARKYNLRYDQQMGELVDRQIGDRKDLAAILNTLPPENLRSLPADAFGKAETISIEDLEKWIIEAKANYIE